TTVHESSRPMVAGSEASRISWPARAGSLEEMTRSSSSVEATLVSYGVAICPSAVPDQVLVGTIHVFHPFVCSALHDLSPLHDHDLVRVADGAQAVRDDDAGHAPPA